MYSQPGVPTTPHSPASPTVGPTGFLWALGPRNPLVHLEAFGWKRHPFRNAALGILFLAAMGGVFMVRNDSPRGSGGYSSTLYRAIRGNVSLGGGQTPSRGRAFWAVVITNFEKGLMRVTTLLPWILAIRSVFRLRRTGIWESLRMTSLRARDWVAGLLGPPIVLSTLGLAFFLVGVILPDFWSRYPAFPPDLRLQYRTSLLATIPFIGLEGAANGLLVAAVTLHEALRSRRPSTVVARSLGWILAIQLLHAFAIYGLATLAGFLDTGGSYPRYVLISHGFQLTLLAAVKTVVAAILLSRIVNRFTAILQRDSEVEQV